MNINIKLNENQRIAGDIEINILTEGNKVNDLRLNILSNQKDLKSLLKKTYFKEIPEIISRTYGNSSVSYIIGSLLAIENAFDIKVTKQTKNLRKLMIIGERIRNFAHHLYYNCLLDYLGCNDLNDVFLRYKKEMQRAVEIIELGNDIISYIGGKSMHPVSAIVGGFNNTFTLDQKKKLLTRLKMLLPEAVKTYELFNKINYPTFSRIKENVSLKKIDDYPLIEGSIISNRDFASIPEKFEEFLENKKESNTKIKYIQKNDKNYFVGPLSRLSNNFKLITGTCERLIKKSRISFPSYNPFHTMIAESLEIIHWMENAVNILENTEFFSEKPNFNFDIKKSVAIYAIESPEGILYQRYNLDKKGYVTDSYIINPIEQNLKNIELDLRSFVTGLLSTKLKKEEIILEIKKFIRSYNMPFIGSTHI